MSDAGKPLLPKNGISHISDDNEMFDEERTFARVFFSQNSLVDPISNLHNTNMVSNIHQDHEKNK